jgi:hypothetical protein
MLNDDWDYITRSAIERAADFVGLEASEIFKFEPVEFWKQIETEQQCTFLRGNQDQRANGPNVTIRVSDNDATNEITDFLREFVPQFEFVDHRRDEAEYLKQARSENCIVIGSPKSNAATEILLSRFFGAKPFDSSDEERFKIPFGFCWPSDTDLVKGSTLTCSTIARRKTKQRTGIAVKDGIDVPANYMTKAEFTTWSEKNAKDCGLLFVANKPFGTDRDVKLIVLAGFSGIGTLGAAKALIEDCRYLEPNPGERCVYGIVECRYSKLPNDDVRTYIDFRWKYRSGGYMPIGVKPQTIAKGKKGKR